MPSRKHSSIGAAGARFALTCAAAAHAGLNRHQPDAHGLLKWLLEYHAALGIASSALPQAHAELPLGVVRRQPVAAPVWAKAGTLLRAACRALARTPETDADAWLAAVAAGLQLDALDRRILEFALRYELDQVVENLWDEIIQTRHSATGLRRDAALFGLLLGVPAAEVERRLAPRARLLASGLISEHHHEGLSPLDRLVSLIARGTPPPAEPCDALLGAATAPAPLAWEDFAHLGAEAETLAAVLRAALERRTTGVNILFYGPPGTGKTSLAATVAARVGARLRPVGEADEDDGEPSRRERLAALRLGQRLVQPGGTVLLFDECEDLFAAHDSDDDGQRIVGSRVFINRLLENNPLPVIWAANTIGAIDPAARRRMTMCLHVQLPAADVRARQWERLAKNKGVRLSSADARAMARLIPAAPAVAAAGMRAAALTGGDSATAKLVVEGIARALNNGHLPPSDPVPPRDFEPALVNADADPVALLARLSAPEAPRAVSLLVSGPPGTGKTAFVRHLAERMGLPPMVRRASDILDAFLGGTEQRIAAAFSEARAAGAFLVFDEVDSLLLNRKEAVRSWEITQVNEMLTWMDEHPLPFAATTNLPERLDPASLRRFLVKLRFGWLDEARARAAFRRFFGLDAPAALDALRTLTPADFALVARRRAVHGAADTGALLDLLRAECAGRVGGKGKMGF